MANIWSRNRFYSGVSETPTFASGDAVAENNSTDGYLTKFVISPITDALNRSVWFRTLKYQFLKAFVHKEEDRDSVTATPSTLTKYVAKDQLPEITSVVNDMTDGSDTAGNINMFDISTDVSGINKLFKLSFSSAGLTYLKARTWLQSELIALINTTIYGSTETTGLIPVGTIWDYCGLDDPDGFINLCLTGSVRSISKASGAGTLKNDNYQNLFIKLYLSYADIRCPVSGGRSGADATAALNDFVSGKSISLPDYRGRVGGYYKLGDDNFGEIGKPIGSEIIDATKLPITSPYQLDNSNHHHAVGGSWAMYGHDEGARSVLYQSGSTPSGDTNITIKTNDMAGGQVANGGQKHFQPTIIQTAIIKY